MQKAIFNVLGHLTRRAARSAVLSVAVMCVTALIGLAASVGPTHAAGLRAPAQLDGLAALVSSGEAMPRATKVGYWHWHGDGNLEKRGFFTRNRYRREARRHHRYDRRHHRRYDRLHDEKRHDYKRQGHQYQGRRHHSHGGYYRRSGPQVGGYIGVPYAGRGVQTGIYYRREYVPVHRPHRRARAHSSQAGHARPQPWTPGWYDYCRAKYRSFNARTGRYLAYSGRYRMCR